ncbi:GAF domain-containing protein [Actinoplanes sp. DH11]|uniref:GAF domain-containing protein n=1 Tax=Actinoplanes sp. DH11 TaxID=2857011 RepID=UPI001E3855CC|nr:GAF domain-containing protein [Actinoplanes sp. DH11]
MPQSSYEATSLDVLVDSRTEMVSTLLAASAPVRDELQAVVDDVAARLNAPVAALNLVRDDAVLFAAATGVTGWIAECGGVPAGWSVCPRVVNPDKPLLVGDLHAESWGPFRPAALYGNIRAYAGVPLRVGGTVVGTLCAFAAAPNAFDERAVAVLEDRGHHAVRLLDR